MYKLSVEFERFVLSLKVNELTEVEKFIEFFHEYSPEEIFSYIDLSEWAYANGFVDDNDI